MPKAKSTKHPLKTKNKKVFQEKHFSDFFKNEYVTLHTTEREIPGKPLKV